jgi:predicted class III extradiol MEMO1 family dioxygenase
MFYPSDPAQCERLARQLVRGASSEDKSSVAARVAGGAGSGSLGAIVPHAGWIASGAIAGESLRELAAKMPRPPGLVVVFGAVHTPIELPLAALDSYDRWALPGGEARVARELGRRLVGGSELFAVDDRLHVREHAVEVELPLVRAVWPDAEVLPVEVPLIDDAAEIGRHTARQVEIARDAGEISRSGGGAGAGAGASAAPGVVFLASSDLTHYGPAYRFAPAGVGPQGLAWAKDNDRRLLDLVTALAIDRIVPEVRQRANACGGGAIVAMLAACREFGASRAAVLRHASSFETLADVHPQPPVDAVGYAAVVVG